MKEPDSKTECEDEEYGSLLKNKKKKRNADWLWTYTVFSHVLFAILMLVYTRRTTALLHRLPAGIYSPAADIISYEIKSENAASHDRHSIYSGPPSDENEDAWATIVERMNLTAIINSDDTDMLKASFFAASREEMIAAGENFENATEVSKVYGGGYLTTFGVYHEIHCLRQLRFLLYREKYYPNLTETQENYLHGHLDHCIEALRISVMCSADTSFYTFYWPNPNAHRPSSKSNAKRYCVNWDALDGWARERAIDLDPWLIRPGKGDDLVGM
ncbi:MAG: hypothetical protein M1822_009007 [Bathelium mastoideum]|nr:MAG: hypothetical protein M1822_009007 [Bathelium mastoideum]